MEQNTYTQEAVIWQSMLLRGIVTREPQMIDMYAQIIARLTPEGFIEIKDGDIWMRLDTKAQEQPIAQARR